MNASRSRLEREDPTLAAAIAGASPDVQRRVAISAARYACTTVGLANSRIGDLLDAAERDGLLVEIPARAAVRGLAQQFDEAGWDLQDGTRSAADVQGLSYEAAFSRARAATAALDATGPDPLLAALDAVYEASMSFEPPSLPAALRSSIRRLLDE